MFIVMNHYSNENINEFGQINHFTRAYSTLEAAKKAIANEVREDRASRDDDENLLAIETDDVCLPILDDIVYAAGIANPDDFERYHSVYVVIEVTEDTLPSTSMAQA